MKIDLGVFAKISKNKSEENKKFLSRLKKLDARKVDGAFHEAHEEVFAETDCLTCANCCKTTSPIFYQTDIERVSKFLRMKPGDFIEKYLRIDEDKDYVLKTSPCPFLGEDNYCSIYESRPKACREYPHTDPKENGADHGFDLQEHTRVSGGLGNGRTVEKSLLVNKKA